MLTKFLKEVVTIVVGKQAEDIVDLLKGNKNVNEFLITKKLGFTINQTRNILYKLSNHGLVSSIRKKDKKKGWYTYFWKLEVLKCLDFLKNFLNKRIEQFSYQIKSREVKLFYNCERCNIEFTEENALNQDFICSECGNVFTVKDNSKLLKEFRKNLTKLQNELDLVEEEIRKIIEKEEKKKERELEKIKKEKVALKKKTALKKKKLVKKKKKIVKKKIVKKPKKKVKKKVKKKKPKNGSKKIKKKRK